MKYSRVKRNRIRKVKKIILEISVITVLALSLVFIASLDNNREWTYEECVKTYYGYNPTYIQQQCNYLNK